MTDYYVAPGGVDTNPGTTGSPFLTMGKANTVAVSGDRILARTGVYSEAVQCKSGVTYMRATTGDVPVLDGTGGKFDGFWNFSGISAFVIDGWEVRNFYRAGINISCIGATLIEIKNSEVHHCGGTPDDTNQYGIATGGGATNLKIHHNAVHHIGPGGQATGIKPITMNAPEIHHNLIYACRKECFRAEQCLNASFHDNICFDAWTGIATNFAVSTLIYNNYVAYCAQAYNPKHSNHSGALTQWGLSVAPAWERFWHNTTHQFSDNHCAIGISDEPADKVDIRNNIFSGWAPRVHYDQIFSRTSNFILDGNCYAQHSGMASLSGPGTFGPLPTQVYTQVNSWGDAANGCATLAELKASTIPARSPNTATPVPVEANGLAFDPQLNDPDNLDLDYPGTSPAAAGSVNLTSVGSPLGAQLGARGLTSAMAHFDYFAAVVSATPDATPYNYAYSDHVMIDAMITTHPTDAQVVLDLGSALPVNHARMDIFINFDQRNPQHLIWEVGNSASGPWTVALDVVNPDTFGSGYWYEFTDTYTTRYVRCRILSSFDPAGTNYSMSDFRVQYIAATGSTPPPDPPPPPVVIGGHWGFLI